MPSGAPCRAWGCEGPLGPRVPGTLVINTLPSFSFLVAYISSSRKHDNIKDDSEVSE